MSKLDYLCTTIVVLTGIDRKNKFVVEFMFRLVNSTKNNINRLCRLTQNYLQKLKRFFIDTQLIISVYKLRQIPYQNPNSGHQWRNFASHYRNSAYQRMKTG
jgi:hypothetical protein